MSDVEKSWQGILIELGRTVLYDESSSKHQYLRRVTEINWEVMCEELKKICSLNFGGKAAGIIILRLSVGFSSYYSLHRLGELDHDLCIQLIELYSSHGCLWQTRNKNYSNKNARDDARLLYPSRLVLP